MLDNLRELYQEVIIDHGRNPRNHGELTHASHTKEGFNPVCGDKITLYLQVDNDVVSDIKFTGCGCAISMASASLMSQAVLGLPIIKVKQLFADFKKSITGDGAELEQLGKIAVLVGVRDYPTRVKCATLAWHTLLAALDNDDTTVSTE